MAHLLGNRMACPQPLFDHYRKMWEEKLKVFKNKEYQPGDVPFHPDFLPTFSAIAQLEGVAVVDSFLAYADEGSLTSIEGVLSITLALDVKGIDVIDSYIDHLTTVYNPQYPGHTFDVKLVMYRLQHILGGSVKRLKGEEVDYYSHNYLLSIGSVNEGVKEYNRILRHLEWVFMGTGVTPLNHHPKINQVGVPYTELLI